MRILTLLFGLLFIVVSPAQAADEFGERFGTSSATAFSDPAPSGGLEIDPAMALQNIEPAAGDETDAPAAAPSMPQWDEDQDLEALTKDAQEPETQTGETTP